MLFSLDFSQCSKQIIVRDTIQYFIDHRWRIQRKVQKVFKQENVHSPVGSLNSFDAHRREQLAVYLISSCGAIREGGN